MCSGGIRKFSVRDDSRIISPPPDDALQQRELLYASSMYAMYAPLYASKLLYASSKLTTGLQLLEMTRRGKI